jgi:S1-C subfamily serine protease
LALGLLLQPLRLDECRMAIRSPCPASPWDCFGLTTNSGYVANHFSVDTRGRSVILGDVRINHGNSGGPAYSDKDGKIIGYAVEYKLAQEGGNSGLAVIIPAHEIATALEDVSSLDK